MTTTLPEASANATEVTSSRVLQPAPDPAFLAWERGSRAARKEDLLAEARETLNRLIRLETGWDGYRAPRTEPLAARVMNGVLGYLIRDDHPTPQIAPLSDGGVQVEWLVNGQSVEIDVSPSGQVIVLAQMDVNADYIVDAEFDFSSPDTRVIRQVAALLDSMAEHVQVRRTPR